MKISARVENSFGKHVVGLKTNDTASELQIPPKSDGFGSSANGGELLCLALATCYCNDLYREAKKRRIVLKRVQVEVEATFGGEGAAAEQITYRAEASSDASFEEIRALMRHTDTVAEIQNTIRRSCSVTFTPVEAESVR